MREYLINYARSLIYTTAMGLPTLAMIKSVYRLMADGSTAEVRNSHPFQSGCSRFSHEDIPGTNKSLALDTISAFQIDPYRTRGKYQL